MGPEHKMTDEYNPEVFQQLQRYFVYDMAKVDAEDTDYSEELIFVFAADFVEAVKRLMNHEPIKNFDL